MKLKSSFMIMKMKRIMIIVSTIKFFSLEIPSLLAGLEDFLKEMRKKWQEILTL